MQSNPIVDRQKEAEEEYRKKESFRYPFRITCIYRGQDNWDFPIFHEVKKYCQENHLTFSAREYDYERFPEDINIARLLAFHVYEKQDVIETYYFDQNPVHKIQVIVWAFEDVERERAKARQRRKEQWDRIKEGFHSLFDRFRRKPALDMEASQSKERSEVPAENEEN